MARDGQRAGMVGGLALLETAIERYRSGELASAEEHCDARLREAPSDPAALNLKGALAMRGGRHETAETLLARAAALAPRNPEFLYNHGLALKELGRYADAEREFRHATGLAPAFVEARYNLACALLDLVRHDEAEAHYREVLRLRPDHLEAQNNLGVVLLQAMRYGEAVACFRRALEIHPGYSHAYCNLGNVDKDIGRIDEALEHYRRSVELEPGYSDAHSNLLLSLNYTDKVSRAEVYAEHRAWAERHEAPLLKDRAAHANGREPERRLRVGYVSPDFRRHSVAYFIEPLIEHHDRSRFEVYCYSNTLNTDDFTARLMGLADHARNILGMADVRAAELVRTDGIDILVDLAGHTAKGRLKLFALKPAPVQVAYLGYPNTTGMRSIDWRLTDVHADPPGEGDEYHSERLARLAESFLCYQPPREAPAVQPAPALAAGQVTFGSFNLLAKVTPEVIGLWAELLKRVPGSRLLLKSGGLGDAFARTHVLSEFARHGIGEARLTLLAKDVGYADHLARYHAVDLALDPFPYNGTTTTFDALWMGVPVVSLAADRHAGRVGKSILENLGLAELIAHDPARYLEICTALANDPTRLNALRLSMRERLAASPLLDGPGLTRAVEHAYRDMWHKYCAA